VSEDQGYEKSASFYDLFDTKGNVAFFLHYGRITGEILDIGAGTGRIAIPLAEQGVKVFCVEPSLAMRGIFKGKLSHRTDLVENITLIPGEASTFNFDREFPTAFLSGSFDHLLDDDERIASLANIGRHVIPGGKLVLDVFIGLMKEKQLSPAGEVVEGGRIYRRWVGVKVLPEERLETTLVYEVLQDGQCIDRIEQISYAGITSREKVHELLRRTGFEVVREFGDYDRREFEEGDALLIVEAEKGPAK
jgi:SAM-dependent methyltransferase